MEWVGGEEDIFTFPDTFSLAERRQIHNICDQLKLVHKSTGEGDSRRLVVTRVPITPDGVICVIPSVTPTSDIPDRSVNHSPTAPVLAIEYPQSGTTTNKYRAQSEQTPKEITDSFSDLSVMIFSFFTLFKLFFIIMFLFFMKFTFYLFFLNTL